MNYKFFVIQIMSENRYNETPPGGCAARCGVLLVLVVVPPAALCGSLCGVCGVGSVFIWVRVKTPCRAF